jgi:AbrB family looped-hinge helix DNA binding protein
MAVTTMDAKGRIAIPAEIRAKLGLESGDAFFFEADENDVIRIAKAQNPFDALAENALEERRAGRTRRLRDYAAERGIDLNAE